jgi:protoporphyrinogen oxidase
MNRVKRIAILGGGPAGLSAGYFARKRGLPFEIYEARDTVGGNAVTFEHRGFRIDSGAHCFRARDAETTAEVRDLLGDDLVEIALPSQIRHRGKLIDIPLSPLGVLTKLGPAATASAVRALVRAKLRRDNGERSFRAAAVRGCGEVIAAQFLLNYSEKLWGLPPEQLSPAISGERSTGPTLGAFFQGSVARTKAKSEQPDGSFYYPTRGYGMIVEKLAACCGEYRIHTNAPVTRLVHDNRQIVAVEGGSRVSMLEPSTVISTLPLGALVRALDPRPNSRIIEAARRLRFRNLLLVVFFLYDERVTAKGPVYFPERAFPMTRVYEPKSCSALMSPPSMTSLVAEVPCDPAGEPWSLSDDAIVRLVRPHLERIGWVGLDRLIGQRVYRLSHAYPVPRLGFEEDVSAVLEYLGRFENLRVGGRNGRHAHAHLHDQLRFGRQMIDAEMIARASRWRRPLGLTMRPLPGPVGVHPANPP